jgi:predicted Fe-S protein YdhL (DUF1289 family)
MTAPGPVASPCNNVCRIDRRSGLCAGCHRTIDEIAAWSALSDAHKREVCNALAARRLAALAEAESREVGR